MNTVLNSVAVDPCSEQSENEADPFIVEAIVKKRFNASKVQYEYLIKWIGYSSTEITWELPSNIPKEILDAFEQKLLDHSTSTQEPRRSGLRDRATRKLTAKKDFIVNK